MTASNAGNAVKTILVAEVEPIVFRLIARVLGRRGYHVLSAADGQQAFELFHRHAAKLILLLVEFALPKLSGLEFVSHLPTRLPRIPVLFMTSFGERECEVERALRENFRVLHKPFTADTLRNAVQSAALAI